METVERYRKYAEGAVAMAGKAGSPIEKDAVTAVVRLAGGGKGGVDDPRRRRLAIPYWSDFASCLDETDQ